MEVSFFKFFCICEHFFSDQRLLEFYALMFNWLHELSFEFPGVFDRQATIDWIHATLSVELRHYYALDDSSKIGK